MPDILKFPSPPENLEDCQERVIVSKITPNSRLTFGKYGPTSRRSGKKLCECPLDYLEWIANNLRDSDFHEWAIVAQEIVRNRKIEDAPTEDLEKQADQFLRDAGFDPRNM